MQTFQRIAIGSLAGAFLCAVTAAVLFVAFALFDGARGDEAAGFGLAIGFAGLVIGGLIGLVVSAARLGRIGGAAAGIAATALLVAGYVFLLGSPERYGYFLRESGVIVAVWAIPTVLAGVSVARLQRNR